MTTKPQELELGKLYYPVFEFEYLIGPANDLRARYTSAELHVLPMLFLGFTDEFSDFKNLKKFRLKFLVGNETWIVEDPEQGYNSFLEEVEDGGGI